jgi:hypothetical protein
LKQKQKGRGRPKRKKTAVYWGRLKPLLYFLNLESFDRQYIERRFNSNETDEWNEGDHRQYRKYAAELYLEVFRDTPEALKEYHDIVTSIVLSLINPVTSQTKGEALLEICQRLNRMPYKPNWKPLRHKGIGPMVEMEFAVDRSKTVASDFYFYGLIIEACMTGEIRKLRHCPHCGVFFMAAEFRQVFCNPGHARLYYDNPKRAKDRVYKSRGTL